MAHLSPSAIFSPSVARQQLAVAKDWNYVDRWLASKFNGKPAPPFERNNDTLKALLALAVLNENADEDRDLISKVGTKSLEELQARKASYPNSELLESLEENLTREGQTSLNALAAGGVMFNLAFEDPERLAQKVMELQIITSNFDQVADRVAILDTKLNNELNQITAVLDDLQSEVFKSSSELLKQAIDYQRKTKFLAAKLPELKDRVGSLPVAVERPKPTIQDVEMEENNFREMMALVRRLETQVKGYHGLPHDTDLARLELEQLRFELKEIMRKRDGIFESLVEKESPRK